MNKSPPFKLSNDIPSGEPIPGRLLLSRACFRFGSTMQNSNQQTIFTTCRNSQPLSIGQLAKEGNFIRLVHPEDLNLDIDLLVDIAYKIRTCINTFLSNYTYKIHPDKSEIKFQLPTNFRTTESLMISCHNE